MSSQFNLGLKSNIYEGDLSMSIWSDKNEKAF